MKPPKSPKSASVASGRSGPPPIWRLAADHPSPEEPVRRAVVSQAGKPADMQACSTEGQPPPPCPTHPMLPAPPTHLAVER